MFKVLIIFLLLFISCNQKKQIRNDKNIEDNVTVIADESNVIEDVIIKKVKPNPNDEIHLKQTSNDKNIDDDTVAIDDESQIKEDVFINKVKLIDEILLTESKKEYENLKAALLPVKISESDFNTFKEKCNYKEEIISYYNLIYEEKLKQFKKENRNWTKSKEQFSVSTNDSIMRFNYLINEKAWKSGKWYSAKSYDELYIKKDDSLMYSSDDFDQYKGYDISIMNLWIPLRTDIKVFTSTPFILGDLNHDGKKDCIITVHTEGGWGTSNIYWNDIFIFLNNGDGYDLVFVKNYAQFSSAYRYYPELIKDNYIIGTAYYLDEDDFYRDPSIKKFMKISLKSLN